MAGQIIKRGDNTYLVRLFLGRIGGKRKYHNKTIHGNKKDAERYLNKVLREKDIGEFVEPTKELLGPYLERWLEVSAQHRIAKSTYEVYKKYVSIYLIPGLGELKLSVLDPIEIQEFYNSLINKGLAPKTVRNIHGVLNSALNQAIKWKLINNNPAALVDLPKQSKGETHVLTPEQATKFIKASINSPYKALFSLLISSGIRPGEALALKWGDTDFKKGRVHVQRALSKKGSTWSFEEPKTARSRRSIPLPRSVIKDLKEHRNEQIEEKLKTKGYNDYDLIFAGKHGEPLDHKNILNRHFKPLLKDAGLPDIRLYDLRHTCATLLLSAGENPKIVSERLGHASITMTLDTYSHVLPDMQQGAAEKLEGILFNNLHVKD